MWENLTHGITIEEKVIRTIFVYALLLVLLRITGKRGLAGMNTFDLVVIFLLSNIVQNAVIGNDTSLSGGITGAVTLVVVNALVNRLAVLSENHWLDGLLVGKESTVIEKGQPVKWNLWRYAVRRDELNHAVHLQSGDAIEDVADARLTPTGQLILDLTREAQGATYSDIERVIKRLDQLELKLLSAG